jgi:hypothetical protein
MSKLICHRYSLVDPQYFVHPLPSGIANIVPLGILVAKGILEEKSRNFYYAHLPSLQI